MANWTKGVWTVFGDGEVMADGVESVAFVRTRSDADLICAAPGLYEALESTTRELRGYIERENDRLRDGITMLDLDEPDWHDMQTICENEKLMAKARGES